MEWSRKREAAVVAGGNDARSCMNVEEKTLTTTRGSWKLRSSHPWWHCNREREREREIVRKHSMLGDCKVQTCEQHSPPLNLGRVDTNALTHTLGGIDGINQPLPVRGKERRRRRIDMSMGVVFGVVAKKCQPVGGLVHPVLAALNVEPTTAFRRECE